MPGSTVPIFRWLPDPWRGQISLRRSRRWLQALVLERRHNASVAADAPTFHFYPMRPGPKSSMAMILRRVGARIGHEPNAREMSFAWDTGTWFSPRALQKLPPNAINVRCTDISKTTVDAVWAREAGYSISVDPLTTEGPIVVKPDLNGRHGGRVETGPLASVKPGLVYQRLVDGRPADGSEPRILQMRVVMIGGEIVLLYAKWRRYPKWFTGSEVTLVAAADDHLSAAEQDLLLRFARSIGIEYGELDTLRDRESGRIYVVDANRTPSMPRKLDPKLHDAAFAPQADAFRALLESRR